MKVAEYVLVRDQDIDIFNKKVNDKLADGWRLYKGSYFIRANYLYCQALIKKKKKVKSNFNPIP